MKILSDIADELIKHNSFFIAGHIKPDGDTIGSSIALASLLKRMGKQACLYSKEQIPDYLRFLPGTKNIKITDKVHKKFDCAIILECTNLERMGSIIDYGQASSFINIDHHATSTNFGRINYIDPSASSSAEQVFFLFSHMGVKLSLAEAQGLYVGLVTDTGKFQHSNTTPRAMRMAASLIEAGVKPYKIYDNLFATKTPASLMLLGLSLSTLHIADSGRTAYLEITRSMYKKAGAGVMDSEDIINHTMMMPNVLVGMLFREIEEERNVIKVSFRSRNGYDVNKLARFFGGGGHKSAAGCTINGTLKSVENHILKHVANTLKYAN